MKPFSFIRLFCALGLFHVVLAEDWPEFRGPTGQGLSNAQNLPSHWNAKENIDWRRAIPGKGWSSPIVHDRKIYLTTAVAEEKGDSGPQELHVLCLDARSGKLLWEVVVFEHGPRVIHAKNSHASATPMTDGAFLYVHFGTNGTACLDLEGKIVWKNQNLKYDPRYGSGGSPALGRRALFINCDGVDVQFVVALDRKVGEILWRTARPPHSGVGFSFATPLVIEVDGKRQVVSPASDYACSYDADDGREIWRVHYPTGHAIIPRPLFAHGLVYICTGFGRPSLYAIRPDGRGDVTETHVVWKTNASVPLTPTPTIVGDEIYFVSDLGIASCLDAKTGERHWRERLGGNYSASPVFAEGRIYFQSEEGDGTVIEAGKKFRVISRNPLGERTLASYAIADGAIFIRSLDHLYRISKER